MLDDQQAIARLRRGDLSGLTPLVERYQTQAVRAAYLVTQDRASAEDIVQNVFVRFVRGIQQYDASRPLKPYLMRSVVNDAVKTMQRGIRTVSLDDTGEFNLMDVLPTSEPEPEGIMEMDELKQSVRSALAQLPPEQRAVIALRYYLDMNEVEMADELATPIGTVKWRLHTARKRLRILLGQEG